jgi:hypothetical protein
VCATGSFAVLELIRRGRAATPVKLQLSPVPPSSAEAAVVPEQVCQSN